MKLGGRSGTMSKVNFQTYRILSLTNSLAVVAGVAGLHPVRMNLIKKDSKKKKIQSAKEATGGFVSGAAKGVGYSLSGLSSVGQTILDSTFGAATRWGLGKAGIETKAPVNAGQVIKEKYFTPETTAEKVGFGAEQLAEWFIPAGAGSKVISKIPVFSKLVKGAGSVSKVEKVATGAKEVKTAQEAIQGASKATEIMKTISGTGKNFAASSKVIAPAIKATDKVAQWAATGLGKTALTESLKMGTISAGQSGKVDSGAVISAAFPIGGRIVSPVVKWIGSKVVSKSLGGAISKDIETALTKKRRYWIIPDTFKD